MRVISLSKGVCMAALAGVCMAHAGRYDAIFNRQLDFNNDGFLQEDEIRLGLLNMRSKLNLPALRDKAKKNGGKVPKSIFEDHDKKQNDDDYETFRLQYDPNKKMPYPLAEVDHADLITTLEQPGPLQKDVEMYPKKSRWDFRVRRTKDKVVGALNNSSDTEKNALVDPYAEGALFSYRRDLDLSQDVWSARGAMGLKYSLMDNPDYKPPQQRMGGKTNNAPPVDNTGALQDFSWLITSTFDRVNTRGGTGTGTKEVDQLTIETGPSGTWAWGSGGPLGMSAATGSITGSLATDFEFNKRVWSVNADLEPLWILPGFHHFGSIGNGTNRIGRVSRLLSYRFGFNIHFEGGVVEEAGSSNTLRQYDSFARIGGKAHVEIHPFPDYFKDRLSLEASYERYQGLLRKNTSPDAFRATARYVLNTRSGLWDMKKAAGDSSSPYVLEQRNILWAFQIEYLNGETPFLDEKDHSITVGLGVAF